ncbi:hypothetical protein DPV78_000331 [Talaromyces pinophilus]|nr:hypothetical protein DPV78_000331 [Talaromyces pinophilus]
MEIDVNVRIGGVVSGMLVGRYRSRGRFVDATPSRSVENTRRQRIAAAYVETEKTSRELANQ